MYNNFSDTSSGELTDKSINNDNVDSIIYQQKTIKLFYNFLKDKLKEISKEEHDIEEINHIVDYLSNYKQYEKTVQDFFDSNSDTLIFNYLKKSKPDNNSSIIKRKYNCNDYLYLKNKNLDYFNYIYSNLKFY